MSRGWDDPETARRYQAFARAHPMYRDTSRDVVRWADVAGDMRVVDLCCGTGITTEAVLERLGERGRVHAVDASRAMLDVAREQLHDERVRFHRSPAEQLSAVVPDRVDRVVCNSALWQVDADATFGAVRRVLGPGGRFAFNLPGGLYDLGGEGRVRPEGPDLAARMRRIARERHGYVVPPLRSIVTWKLDYDTVVAKLHAHELELRDHGVLEYRQSRASSRDFHAIPIMTEGILPGMAYEVRMEILDAATAEHGPGEPPTRPWAYFVATPK